MTQQEMIDIVKLSVPKERMADAQSLASAAVKMAILRFNKAEHADFNHKTVTFRLSANKKDYTIGNDIMLSDATKIIGIADMYVDGVGGNQISVLTKEQFDGYAVNSALTGPPKVCALHSKSSILSFWPIPQSAHTIRATIKFPIEGFDSIPIEAQPELRAMATQEIIALTDPNMAAMQSNKAEVSVKSLGTEKWHGQNIPLGRGMDNGGGGKRVDSGNLLGN